jgi:hypothetical protein
MPIPTSFDRTMAALDDWHSCVMVALRMLHHGSRDDAGNRARDMIRGYLSAAQDILEGEEHARDLAQ